MDENEKQAETPEIQQGAEQEQTQKPETAAEPETFADEISKKIEEMERAEPEKAETQDDDFVAAEEHETKEQKPKLQQEGKAEAQHESEPEPKTPEQEEEQILAMAQSERSKERLKQVFQERREGQQAKQSLGTLVKAFADAGYDQESVQTVLSIGRKISSGEKTQVREAIQMLDRIRSNLCQQLGESPELFDPLSDYPELKSQVDNMGLSRDQAMEIAAARRLQAEQLARQQEALRQQQEQAAKAQRVQQAQAAVGAFFNGKRGEIDFQAKMKAIQAHLTPERVQQFVATVPPELWASQLELMYNTIGAGTARPANAPRPISARQASLGHPADSRGASLQDDIMAKMAQMGI